MVPTLPAPIASLPHARVLGVVELSVEGAHLSLPVQAVRFAGSQDGVEAHGGFFVDSRGALGIVVDANLTAADIDLKVREAATEAVKYLSGGITN